MNTLQIEQTRRRLLGLRRGLGVWGYRARTIEAVEPSSLASLALLATEEGSKGEGWAAAQASGRWLSSIQQPDGSLGVSPALPEPGWPTPFGFLIWSALGHFEFERTSVVGWLLGLEGTTAPRKAGDPTGHDSTIVGWPWVAETHSWVEPTAMALISLALEGKGHHPRVTEGIRMLIDRAIPDGGWNMGNPVLFNTNLRPLPAPTGLALLALARLDVSSTVVRPAINYLQKALANTLAPISLGWGLLGLRAWGAEPVESKVWLESAFEQAESREAFTAELALLLLAAGGDRSLEMLGFDSRKEWVRHA